MDSLGTGGMNGVDGSMTPGQNAWGLFALTGGIGFYLLSKELMGEHDMERGHDRRFD